MTARELISAALRLLGAIAPGESLAASEAKDGLSALNLMLDSWSTESLMIYQTEIENFPFVVGKQTYSMGAGGDFDTARPVSIGNALVRIPSAGTNTELPIKVVTEDEWARIILKETASSIPTYLYMEGSYPLATLYIWPVPSVANELVLYSAKPLTKLTSLDSEISMPPGYERALKYNLAVELAPEFGRSVTPEVLGVAVDSKAALKRINSKPQYLEVDKALRASSPTWNWLTGEPT